MTLNANILFSLVANETDAGDYAKDVRTTKVENFIALTDGTGANQAQIAWSDSRTISFGSLDDLNLRSLTDERGTVVFSAIKLLAIKNTGGDGLVVGANATGSFSNNAVSWSPRIASTSYQDGEGFSLPGYGVFFLSAAADGYLVTSSERVLRIGAPEDASASYEIVLIGEGTIT